MTEKHFFTSLTYLLTISLITLIIWAYDLAYIGIPLFLAIVFVLSITVKNTIYLIPFVLNGLFMISQTEWGLDQIPLYLLITPAGLLLSFTLHVLRFKVNLWKGKFALGLGLLGIAVIISTIVNTEQMQWVVVFMMSAAIAYFLIYTFFTNSIKGDHVLYLIKIMVILGVMIALQVFIFYLRIYLEEGSIGVNEALANKEIDLGWGISNFVATYLIMFISTIIYFVKKYKLHIFWIVVMLFEIAMLLFTLSRAGIIAFMITGLFLIIYMFTGYEKKGVLLLNLLIGIVIVGGAAYLVRDYFITIWDRLELLMLDDSGRIDLWLEAIEIIKTNPWFGKGLFARAVDLNELRLFHNTVLHVMASFGVIGGLALVIQFIAIIRIFFYKFSQEKAILLIALVGANVHGMVDNIYLMPQYMILMFIMIAVVENTNKIDYLREELAVRS